MGELPIFVSNFLLHAQGDQRNMAYKFRERSSRLSNIVIPHARRGRNALIEHAIVATLRWSALEGRTVSVRAMRLVSRFIERVENRVQLIYDTVVHEAEARSFFSLLVHRVVLLCRGYVVSCPRLFVKPSIPKRIDGRSCMSSTSPVAWSQIKNA